LFGNYVPEFWMDPEFNKKNIIHPETYK